MRVMLSGASCRASGYRYFKGELQNNIRNDKIIEHTTGTQWTWKAPPRLSENERLIFCGKEHQAVIIAKFRIHFHQHPAIPFDDDKGTHFMAEEIHHGAVHDMYQYCFENDLNQVWAYMWNQWYTPKQWSLWV